MPRSRHVKIGIINIKTHPHSEQNYINLFVKVARELVHYRGDYELVLSSPGIKERGKLKYLVGTIFRGINLIKGRWLDIDQLKEPDYIPAIPPALRAKTKQSPFVFIPKNHLFFFFTKNQEDTFNPSSVANSLGELFKLHCDSEEFGYPEASVVSAKESIDKILTYEIQKLKIIISLPNADLYSGRELQQIKEQLKEQKVRYLSTEMRSQPRESIQPNEETQKLMRVATSEGYVQAEVKTEEGRRIINTTRHPKLIEAIITDIDDEVEVLLEHAIEYIKDDN